MPGLKTVFAPTLKLSASASRFKPTTSSPPTVLYGKKHIAVLPTLTQFPQKRYSSSATQYTPSTNVYAPPDMSSYRAPVSPQDDTSTRNFSYFMVGSFGALGVLGAKNLVSDYLVHFSASAEVLAMAKVEVDLNVVLKWRGKPVFIRHRTASEIEEAGRVSLDELRDKQTDAERTKQPEWLVMLGVCTHLGCVPIGEAGDFGGWFCPCHGSHYDISGRIRKGPAPLNLEIPEYSFNEDKLIIG